jgi:hypothetical protein
MFDPKPITFDPGQLKHQLNSLLKHISKKKSVLLFTVILCLIISSIWIFIRKPQYKAVTTFVLEEKSSGGGGIAGLASQFGVDLGSLGAGANGFFSGENIDEILASTTVLEKVLNSPVDTAKPQGTKLADLYLDASGMRTSMSWKKLLNGFSFYKDTKDPVQLRFRDSVMYAVMDRITQKDLVVDRSNKKGTIFKISISSKDPLFAKLFTERLVDITSTMYVDIKTRNITGNIKKLEARADSLRGSFQSKSYRSYQAQVLDANEAFSSIKATGEVSQRDKTVAFELYAEVAKNLELSRMMLINQTPVIQVLDRPRETLADSNMAAWKIITLASIAGLFIGLMIAAFSYKPNPAAS